MTSRCRVCGRPIMWARTVASESGAGGKAMPLDPDPDPAGNVAVREVTRTHHVARVLARDETHDHQIETLHTTHFATCPGPNTPGEDQ